MNLRIARLVDTVHHVNIKTTDPVRHRALTGRPLDLIHANCTSLQGAVVFPANTIAIDTSWDGSANGFFNGSKIASVDMSAASFTTITDASFNNCVNLEWANHAKEALREP